MSPGSSTPSGSGSQSPRSGEGHASKARLSVRPLPVAGITLFVCFACLGLTPFAAPALMNPAWQLRFASSLISHAYLPLMGLSCFYLDKYLTNRVSSPARPGAPDASTKMAHWAVAASLGFLLLFPLQITAATSLIAKNFSQIERPGTPADLLNSMQDIVRNAPDAETIQRRFSAIRGPALSPTELRKPLPQLKSDLLATLKQAENELKARRRNESGRRTFILIFDCLRLSVMAVAYAVAFAAFGQRHGQRHTVLEEVIAAMGGGRPSIRVGGGY
jgi:hypothetical protein